MFSGADLFVVCKQCGSEVSAYITECPYCGHRLRRRAPRLPREPDSASSRRARIGSSSLGRLRKGEIAGVRAESPPYATMALVAVSCAVWVATHATLWVYEHLPLLGPPAGQWWRLLTSNFVYLEGFYGGAYAFVAIAATAIFGTLLERRYGPVAVLVVFFGAGAAGMIATLAAYSFPEALGANAGALGLLGAWAVPDLLAARARRFYDGDLLASAAIAAVLLAMALARLEASFLAGAVGGLAGLTIGFCLTRLMPDRA